jgi:hypothetical protein
MDQIHISYPRNHRLVVECQGTGDVVDSRRPTDGVGAFDYTSFIIAFFPSARWFLMPRCNAPSAGCPHPGDLSPPQWTLQGPPHTSEPLFGDYDLEFILYGRSTAGQYTNAVPAPYSWANKANMNVHIRILLEDIP